MSPKGVENGLTRGSTSAAQDSTSQRTLSFHTGTMTVEGTRAAMGDPETKASTNGDAAAHNHHQRDPTSKPQTLKLTWGKKNSQALQAAVPVDSAPHSPSSEPPAISITTSGRKSRQRNSSSGKSLVSTSPVIDISSRRRSRSKYSASNLASSTVSNLEETHAASQIAPLDNFPISPAVSSPPPSVDETPARSDLKSARGATMKEVLPTIVQESPLPRRPRKAKTDAISANAALSRPETPQVIMTASTSRESSPVTELSKPAQRRKRNFAEDLLLPTNANSGARGSHARGNKRAKVMSDDGTTFYEPDVKLRESYRENNPSALPNTYQIGILPLGTMPPPDRWEQVFNTDVPKVPEVFLPSDINFLNYWGSTGTEYTKRTSKDEKRTYWKYKHDGRLDNDDIWVEDYELKRIRRDKEKIKPTTKSVGATPTAIVSTPSNRETRSRQPSTAASKDATPSADAETDMEEATTEQEEQSTNHESTISRPNSVTPAPVDAVMQNAPSETQTNLKNEISEVTNDPYLHQRFHGFVSSMLRVAQSKNQSNKYMFKYMLTTGLDPAAVPLFKLFIRKDATKDAISQLMEFYKSKYGLWNDTKSIVSLYKDTSASPGGRKRKRDEDTELYTNESISTEKPHPSVFDDPEQLRIVAELLSQRRTASAWEPRSRKRPDDEDNTRWERFDALKKHHVEPTIPETDFSSLREELDPDCERPNLKLFEDRDGFFIGFSPRPSDQDFMHTTKSKDDNDDRMEMDGEEGSLSGSDDGVEISNSACTSCGESGGQLILCDGQNKKCNQEVHYHCADPPLSEADVAKLSSWFCRRCSARQAPPPKGHFPGFFGALMHNMDKQNTSAFSLPQDIKARYAGVTAGPTGEYEERPELKNVSKKLKGFEYITDEMRLPLRKRLYDVDENLITCWKCRKSKIHPGIMLACDYCSFHWHIDCLPESICAPYAIRNNKLKMWKCPLHSSDEYLPVRRLKTGKTSASDAITHPLLRSVVALEKSVPEMQFRDWTIGGEVHKLPEEGVILRSWTNDEDSGAEADGEVSEEYTRQEIEGIFSLTELLHESLHQALQPLATFLPATVNAATAKQEQINTVVSALLELADDRTRQMLSDPVMSQVEEATILKALEALVLKRLGQLEASAS